VIKDNISINEMGAVINVEELTSVLKISRSKAYELVKMETFPIIKLGKRILIPTDALLKWLNYKY